MSGGKAGGGEVSTCELSVGLTSCCGLKLKHIFQAVLSEKSLVLVGAHCSLHVSGTPKMWETQKGIWPIFLLSIYDRAHGNSWSLRRRQWLIKLLRSLCPPLGKSCVMQKSAAHEVQPTYDFSRFLLLPGRGTQHCWAPAMKPNR